MARLDPGASARWLSRRAKEAAASLKAEYDAGTRGDDSPTEPIYPTPSEQLAALTSLLAGSRRSPAAAEQPGVGHGERDVEPDAADAHGDQDETVEQEADEVAAAMRRLDWQQVRAATAERTGAAADAMRTMAREVDWAKVQPVAGQVSSALIAAVASGRLPVAGRMGPLVAKAISDRGALAQRIGVSLSQDGVDLPPDFRAHVTQEQDAPDGAPVAPLPRWEETS